MLATMVTMTMVPVANEHNLLPLPQVYSFAAVVLAVLVDADVVDFVVVFVLLLLSLFL